MSLLLNPPSSKLADRKGNVLKIFSAPPQRSVDVVIGVVA